MTLKSGTFDNLVAKIVDDAVNKHFSELYKIFPYMFWDRSLVFVIILLLDAGRSTLYQTRKCQTCQNSKHVQTTNKSVSKVETCFGKVRNILGKRENAGDQHFLSFRKWFRKPSFSGVIKSGLCGKELKGV